MNNLDTMTVPELVVVQRGGDRFNAGLIRAFLARLLLNVQSATGAAALAELTTTEKTSLVLSLNEVNALVSTAESAAEGAQTSADNAQADATTALANAATAATTASTAATAAATASTAAATAQTTANTAVTNAATAQTAANLAQAGVDAIVAENTDVVIPIDIIGQYFSITGGAVWTASRPATAQYRLRRTAAAAVQVIALKAFPRSRTSSNKGVKVTGFTMSYAVSTAALNDVVVDASYQTLPADTAAPGAAVSFGTMTYDSAHGTSNQRKAVASHTMTVTFGTPVYLPAGVDLVEVTVSIDGTATGVFDLLGAELLCAETLTEKT